MGRPKNKDEYRREMAEAFANLLEEKGLSWRKEWHGVGGGAPQNGVTRACYRGCNAFWLSLVAMKKGYNDPRWVTFVQIADKDGHYHPKEKWHLKEGSKATFVEYWYPFDLKEKRALTWEQYKQLIKDGRKPEEFHLSTRYTAVFNAAEIEGMPEIEIETHPETEMEDLVRTLSENMGVPFDLDGGDQAYYSPKQDHIHLPTPESFENTYAFNATALHELSHATGHPTRLNRDMGGVFGSASYAYEELVAEMSACFMGSELLAEPTESHIENHKAYVQTWVKAIREKPEALVRAIKDAQNAASYLDWKAGRITEQEYAAAKEHVYEVRTKEAKDRAEER